MAVAASVQRGITRSRVNMIDDAQETHRHHVLGLLFGSDVPEELEGQLLRTADVATLFQVSERTVSEWAKRGQIPSVRTPGGHRRYPAEGIRTLLEGGRQRDPQASTVSSGTTGSA
jgi:excisionase family DNA binding protein